METLRYPVELHKDKDGITVMFPDMPYGVTCGETTEEALANAVDCLEEIIASLMKDKKSIPKPSHAHKRPTITLSPTFSAKVLLYKALREKHITKAELARRLHWKSPQVDRLFDTHHSSQLSQLVIAAAALGKIFVMGIEDVKS
jgi:antitoxin HicB